MEGARLDFSYPGTEDIYEICETARFRHRGIPAHRAEEARALMTLNLPWFDHARRFIAGLTTAGMSCPDPVYLQDRGEPFDPNS